MSARHSFKINSNLMNNVRSAPPLKMRAAKFTEQFRFAPVLVGERTIAAGPPARSRRVVNVSQRKE
jgi:hypothetical protein